MNWSHKEYYLICGISFLMCFHITAEEYKPCPTGFDLSYDERHNEYICFKLKEPENFKDKYVDCEENIYNLELHFGLNITELSTVTFWIDYRSVNPGGPYGNVENTKDANVSHGTCEELYDCKESCLVVTGTGIITAAQCDEIHNRYCFVKSLLQNNMTKPRQDLQTLSNTQKSMCLLTITNTSNITWMEAKSLCENKEVSEFTNEIWHRNMTQEENQPEVFRHLESRNVEVEEIINQVLDNLKQLLENQSPIVMEELEPIFDQVEYLMDLELDIAVPHELPRLLHELGPRVDPRFQGIIVRGNIALNTIMDDGTLMTFVSGYIVHRWQGFAPNAFEIIGFHSAVPPEILDPLNTDVVVFISHDLVGRFFQHNYLVLWDGTFFHDPRGVYTINSRVISINHNTNSFLEDTTVHLHLRPLITQYINTRRACVRWHFFENGSGCWTEEGCMFMPNQDPEQLDSCACDMMFTYFAEALALLPVRVTAMAAEVTKSKILVVLQITIYNGIRKFSKIVSLQSPKKFKQDIMVEELIDQLLNDLRQLLEQDIISDVDHVFDQMNNLFELDDVVFPDELLYLFQELIGRQQSGDFITTTVRNNVVLVVATPASFVRGITVARSDDHIFREETVNTFSNPVDSSMLDVNVNDAVITVITIESIMPRISYMVFQDGRVFSDSNGPYTVISRILSMNFYTLSEFENEDHVFDLHIRPLVEEQDDLSRRTCVRWIFNDDSGYWSEEGCVYIMSYDPGILDTCQCTWYLTYYALALFSEPTETTTVDETTVDDTTIKMTTEMATEMTTTEATDTTETITITPEDQIQEVLEDLYDLLNQTDPIFVEDISEVFDQVDDLLNLDPGLDFPGEMLQLLEELGTRVDLHESPTSAVVRNNIGLLMADVTEDNPVRGLVVASRDSDDFTPDAFEFLIGQLDSNLLNINVSEAVVSLPPSVTRYPRRISFVVYRDNRAFSYDRDIYVTNSRILSISVGDHTPFERGEVVDIHLRPTIGEPNRDERRVCAYWRFLGDGTGYWSQEGCTLIRSRDPWTLDTCRCDHLTHFAEVLFPRSVFSQLNEDILQILSIIGCFLSIFGIAIIILTAVVFRAWRKDFKHQIWLQLSIALLIISVCFLIVTFSKFYDYSISCMLTGIGLHYSILASFCWMLVAAVQSYKDIVLVTKGHITHRNLKSSGFSWGLPVIIIGILLSVNPQAYSGYFEEMNPSSAFCYPSGAGLFVALYTPIVVVLLVNWTIFILIIQNKACYQSGVRSHKGGYNQEAFLGTLHITVLPFTSGLPWLFGLFGYNVVAAYFFTCTVTTQGFVLFLLLICVNAQTKNLWLIKLKWNQRKTFTVTSNN